jgi:hypothetical protein
MTVPTAMEPEKLFAKKEGGGLWVGNRSVFSLVVLRPTVICVWNWGGLHCHASPQTPITLRECGSVPIKLVVSPLG